MGSVAGGAGEVVQEARPRPRPTFELFHPDSPEVLLARVKAALQGHPAVRGMVLPPRRIELTVPDADRKLWSPQLTVDVTPTDEGSRIWARFGPDAHVWTFYVALHALSVFGAFVCLAFGVSQWVAGSTPWVLYLTPLSVLLSGLVHGAAYVGQGLGSDQMYRVRAFLEESLAESDDGRPEAGRPSPEVIDAQG
jgi:hypothetical protein